MKNDLPRPEYSAEPPSAIPSPRAAPVRRHRVSAIEGDAEDVDVPDSGGNLSRIFTFLLLLHVFLIGAVVLYNLIAEKPANVGAGVETQVAATETTSASTSTESVVTPRSEVVAEGQAPATAVNTVEYIVTPGKNLQNIAEETGVSSEQIVELNNLNENGALYVGRKLRIPAKGGAPAIAPVAPAVEAPKVEKPMVVEAPKVQAPVMAQPAAEKKVEKPVADAPAKNIDKPAEKRPEPAVAVKTVEKKAEPAPAAKLDAPAKPAAAKTAATASGRSHQVQNGETFYGIARKHDVSVNELMKLNGFSDPGKLRKGTVLKLPAK